MCGYKTKYLVIKFISNGSLFLEHALDIGKVLSRVETRVEKVGDILVNVDGLFKDDDIVVMGWWWWCCCCPLVLVVVVV